MLSHNINPVIFRLEFTQVTWYALVYIIGFLIALVLLLRASKKKEVEMKEGEVYDFIFWCIIGLMVGARLFHIVFWGWNYYISDPIKMLYIWQGGLSFHGGLVGALIVTIIYTRMKGIGFWKVADILALLGVVMPVFSRLANFINQEIVGTITDVPWCFKFKYNEGCRHPVQLYAAFGRAVFFFALLWVKKSLKKYKEGFIFWSFIFGIGMGRFMLDFWRKDVHYWGLAAGQWLSLIMVVVGGYMLHKFYRKDVKRILKKG